MAIVYAVMRDSVFVENTFTTKEEAENYIGKLKNLYSSNFSIRRATTTRIRQFLEQLTLEPVDTQ
jgi:hypothetical protein